jgi:Carbohydrate/starch-binding module (family 21)
MPYTPPSQLSPVSSKSNSPGLSRSHSYVNGQLLSPESAASSNRPNLPRSAGSSSYLQKHRRSPSLNEVRQEILYNGEAAAENSSFDPHGSIRQSPPPSNNALIPTGMTISPPDSAQNSSDEEDNRRGRGRDLEADTHKELHAALSGIEQRRQGSPNRTQHKNNPQTANKVDVHDFANETRPPLSQEARKVSHSRSATDSNIVFDTSAVQVSSPVKFKQDSDEDDDSDGTSPRPSMVRKKSGELVRPALRPPSRRRPSSMPGTPTYSKAVHFDSHLEHVRHFLQVDRPLAVSAGSSPVEQYESESEFPFGSDEAASRSRAPPFEWEIKLANFPYQDVETRKALPVHVERVFLSADNKTMIGSIAVQNLSFSKTVVARFTFDYWKTTSEVVADFNHDVRRKQQNDGLDRFNFSIKLADQVNLESKTMFFCVRYSVNGQEYWDSNSGFNYQVDFSKKPKPQNGKNAMPGLGARPLNALPRSRPSPPTSSGQRPRSYPVSFDDFAAGFDSLSFGQSAGSLMGEPKLKLRSPRSKTEIVPDAPTRRGNANSQAFGNRYDFNSSLTAAKHHAFAVLGEQSGLPPSLNAKQSSRGVPTATTPVKAISGTSSRRPEIGAERVKAELVSKAPAVGLVPSKPAALISEKPSLASQSYQELVEKYCFVGAHGKSEEVRSH